MSTHEDRELEAWEVARGRGSGARKPASRPAQPQPEILAEHTVSEGETLSHIALKHYGSAVEEKWMAIYEANREVIGENPNLIKPGQVLKIPKLS